MMKTMFFKIWNSIIGKICIVLLGINFILSLYNLFQLSAYINTLSLVIVSFVAIVILLLLILCTYKLPKLSLVFHIILCILLVIGCLVFNRASSFTNQITQTDEVETVEIDVLKESSLNENSSLDGLTMGCFLDDSTGLTRAREILKEHEKTGVKEKQYDNMKDAYQDLLDNKIDMIVITSLSSSYLEEEVADYRDHIRPLFIKEYAIENTFQNEKLDITKDPFTVYLGGVDLSCNGKINGTGRGDVNILLTINPTTKKASMQVIPRDLYSYIPIKDAHSKLSYSGNWGGVQSSIASIEHELGVKINYYAKINFDGLTDLIDKIGGIDVYSHYDYTINDFHYQKGMNHVNGEQALAMARERKSLPLNERSRGLQQMEIIKGIMNKLFENPSYDYMMSALDSIQENFMTNLPKDQFIDAFQLFLSMRDTLMNIETYSMNGEYKWHYDEVKKGYYLYYFYPSDGEIEKVRDRINNILQGN